MPELSEADMLTFEITFPGEPLPYKVRAAYPTSDEKLAGWTLFKDCRHKTVAMIPAGAALLIRATEAAG